MKIKIFTLIAFCVILYSCNSNRRINLENAINRNLIEFIGGKNYDPYFMDREEYRTMQPAFLYKEESMSMLLSSQYRLGDIILFSDGNIYNSLSFIVNSINEKKIIGVLIDNYNNDTEADRLKGYLKKTLGNPEIIRREPFYKDDNDILIGNDSTFFWLNKQSNTSIYFYKIYDYNYNNENQRIGYHLGIIQNDTPAFQYPNWKVIDTYRIILHLINEKEIEEIKKKYQEKQSIDSSNEQ